MCNTILEKIVKNKKIWIENHKKKIPLIKFKNKIKKTDRYFDQAIKNMRPAFILECKKSSPSLGIIKDDFDIIKIANTYKKYAAVISVLTDEKYFQGKFEFLSLVSSIVNQPVLCKDFFIDPYQIYLARYYQADAILLMLSILSDSEYLFLSTIAKSMNMGILTEVNNIKELHRALSLKATVIGINNRNLHDLSIDINRTKTLAPLISNNALIISESGIQSYSQIRMLSKLVHGFLIGSALMMENDLDVAVCKMIMGNNKICGLTRSEDAKISKTVGVIYGGLIFIKNSKRYIDLNDASKIIYTTNLKYIGVFQNEKINTVVFIAKTLSLHAVQLHGNENQDYINLLREKLPIEINIWKAFSIKNTIPNCNWLNVDYYLFDNLSGGSGKQFNWSILPKNNFDNVILSGGLNYDNCLLASQLGFSGLDFNSGIEDQYGIKNHNKIISIFDVLRNFFKHHI